MSFMKLSRRNLFAFAFAPFLAWRSPIPQTRIPKGVGEINFGPLQLDSNEFVVITIGNDENGDTCHRQKGSQY